MKGYIQFLLPPVLKSHSSRVLAVLQCGQNALAENIFFSYSAVWIIFKCIQTTVQKNIQGDNQGFHSWVAPISSSPQAECHANHICVARRKTTSIRLSQLRLWLAFKYPGLGFLTGDGEINLHRPQISSDSGTYCYRSIYMWVLILNYTSTKISRVASTSAEETEEKEFQNLGLSRRFFWLFSELAHPWCSACYRNVTQLQYTHHSSKYATVHIKLGNRSNQVNHCKN